MRRLVSRFLVVVPLTTSVFSLGCPSDDPERATFTATATLTDAFRGTAVVGSVSLTGANCLDSDDNFLTPCTNGMGDGACDADGHCSLSVEYDPQQQVPDTLTFGELPGAASDLQSYEAVTLPADQSGQDFTLELQPEPPSWGISELVGEALPASADIKLTWKSREEYWHDRFVVVRSASDLVGVEPAWGRQYAIGETVGGAAVIFAGMATELLVAGGADGEQRFELVDTATEDETLYYYALWPTDAWAVYHSAAPGEIVSLYSANGDLTPPAPVASVEHSLTWDVDHTEVTRIDLGWQETRGSDYAGVHLFRSTTGPVTTTPANGEHDPTAWYYSNDAHAVDLSPPAPGTSVHYRLVAVDTNWNYAAPVDHEVAIP